MRGELISMTVAGVGQGPAACMLLVPAPPPSIVPTRHPRHQRVRAHRSGGMPAQLRE